MPDNEIINEYLRLARQWVSIGESYAAEGDKRAVFEAKINAFNCCSLARKEAGLRART